MRWLVISLFSAVFISLLGLGWAIDYFYTNIETENDQLMYPGHQQALHLLVDHIEANELTDSEIENYISSLKLPVLIESLSTYPLPLQLMEELDNGMIITLESASGISFHKRIGDRNVIATIEPVSARSNNEKTRYFLTIAFYTGIAGILLLWLMPLLKGIQKLTVAAQDIGHGKLYTRLVNPGRYYLSPLNKAFNAMAEKLERLNENNQLLSQAVSHELRTPLSRLRFAVDLSESRQSEVQRKEDFQRIGQDLDQMESLINELLLYARMDKQPKLKKKAIVIDALMFTLIENWQSEHCEIKILSPESDKKFWLDEKYIRKVIDNILQNACKYGNGKVHINIEWLEDRLQIKVEDNGHGIDEDKRKLIFSPFLRLDDEKTLSRSGFGLGLAICKRVTQWHGGDIYVETSKLLGGACFVIDLVYENQ